MFSQPQKSACLGRLLNGSYRFHCPNVFFWLTILITGRSWRWSMTMVARSTWMEPTWTPKLDCAGRETMDLTCPIWIYTKHSVFLMEVAGQAWDPLECEYINSLTPGKFEWKFRNSIFKQILVIDGWGITDDQSTLVQVMAWCRQATSHYLSQCWPRSKSPYGVTRGQWVNPLSP